MGRHVMDGALEGEWEGGGAGGGGGEQNQRTGRVGTTRSKVRPAKEGRKGERTNDGGKEKRGEMGGGGEAAIA